MKKIDKLLAVLVVSFLIASKVDAQSANNYIPEVKLLASSDGRYFDEDIKTTIKTGQSYYLRVEASVRVPGKRLQWFGANEISCTIVFSGDQIIDINVSDSDISGEFLSSQQILELIAYPIPNDNSWSSRARNGLKEKLISERIFSLYIFPIPTSPVNDNDLARGVRPKIVSTTFKIDPLKIGSQTIKISFEGRVSDIYNKSYTLVVN